MLEQERFLAIKKLARDIREDNKIFFNNLEDEDVESAIKQKEDFVDKIISNMASAFSAGEQGKEEKQIFRANILIPNDEEFYSSYSEDKNIRSLMNKYAVNIEDIMSKITELNIYGKYINNMESEEDTNNYEETDEFVEEMVNISPDEAEGLLDEIEGLSEVVSELELEKIEEKPNKKDKKEEIIEDSKDEEPEIEEPKKEEPEKEIEQEEKIDNNDDVDLLGDSFENIEGAISGFVVDFNNLKKDLASEKENSESLKRKIQSLTDEKTNLKEKLDSSKKENDKISTELEKVQKKNSDMKKEIEKKDKRMKLLEEKLYKSATLLKKVYNGINK